YICAGWARYVERKGVTHREINYELAGVELTHGLEVILAGATQLTGWEDLVALLLPEYHDLAEIEQFLDDLVDAQVLVSELECVVTCDDPLNVLIEQLCRLAVAPDIASALRRVARTLQAMEQPGAPVTGEPLESIRRDLAQIGAPDFQDNLVHVQLQLTPKAPLSLHDSVRCEIEEAVKYLVLMRDPQRVTSFSMIERELDAFRLAFQRRYDDAMVPVTTALDADNGIGFSGAWSNAGVDRTQPESPLPSLWYAWEGHLAERLARLSPVRADELELTPPDLAHLDRGRKGEPFEFMQVFARLEAESAHAIDHGEFLVHVEQCLGPTESSLSARFAVGNRGLTDRLSETAERTQSGDHRILAEIAHLPGNRAANVVARPRLSQYEIPYLARSDAPEDRQITIRDLHLFVESGRLVLWSKRLNKEVLPRLSSAHAALPRAQLPIYRFLYALHTQQRICALAWDWGNLRSCGWLPRVRIGRSVLSLARWRLSAATIQHLQAATRNEQGSLITSLRADLGLPRFVSVGDKDHPLSLDLDNELTRDLFVDELDAKQGSVVTEVFPTPDARALASDEGPHTFELLVPLQAHSRRFRPTKKRGIARVTHSPGGGWLTLKIYTGHVTADRILRHVLAPAIADLENREILGYWFFLRYADPDFHLRVRLHGQPNVVWGDILPGLHERLQPLIDNDSVFQTVVDSYRPELERYGGPTGLEIAHHVFSADSRCALQVLTSMPDVGSSSDRLVCATAGVNGYYDAFSCLGLSHLAGARLAFDRLASSVWPSDKDAIAGKRQFSRSFRSSRSAIEEAIATPSRAVLSVALEPIARRDAVLRVQAARLRDAVAAGAISQDVGNILSSYTHMHVNRVLRDYDRVVELGIYDSLMRHHESAVARLRTPREVGV
ncbi:MAG: lantibiotic dehydratase, partial [Gemmatimonadaceae bacterium]